MTKDLDQHYGVTVHDSTPHGGKPFEATADLFRRDNQSTVKSFTGTGNTVVKAMDAAMEKAERYWMTAGLSLTAPTDWTDD
ncbi:hypothetical protein O9570_01410 [Achromobacter xylosoxidans]|jgi:hypothetical protein|uniref:Uncharacterized protein n=1 Tax=Alcaligenes xylosoxydans xylosoxydans TaxID=85698 RepID=A0A9X3KUE3_ALCXX|nr:hypothetical protein [Achromobacter xylosoxidans]MCZ8400079.1 hypothetical protein [Achromobacter xylosoxidans]CUI64741.1 Uncharacterised protein [Achromobacter xylosoxidans]